MNIIILPKGMEIVVIRKIIDLWMCGDQSVVVRNKYHYSSYNHNDESVVVRNEIWMESVVVRNECHY